MKIRDILGEDDSVLKNMLSGQDPEDVQDPNLQPKGDPQVSNINGQPISPVALQQAISKMQAMANQGNSTTSPQGNSGSTTSAAPQSVPANGQQMPSPNGQPNPNPATQPVPPAAAQSNMPNPPGMNSNASTQMDTTYGAVPPIGPGGVASNTNVKEQSSDESDKHYDDWMNSEHAPHDDEAGDDNLVIGKAMHFLRGRVHPQHMEQHAHHMADRFQSDTGDQGEITDGHHDDLISQGNQDVGGDATDDFIDQVRDKGFEKAARHGDGSMSTLSESDRVLLDKMLTIAGLR
jgi:hypothetical protein